MSNLSWCNKGFFGISADHIIFVNYSFSEVKVNLAIVAIWSDSFFPKKCLYLQQYKLRTEASTYRGHDKRRSKTSLDRKASSGTSVADHTWYMNCCFSNSEVLKKINSSLHIWNSSAERVSVKICMLPWIALYCLWDLLQDLIYGMMLLQ